MIDADGIFPRYGYPNDLLARLNGAGLRVVDVPVRAVYGPNWRSGIGWSTVIYPMSFVLLRSFARRLWHAHRAPNVAVAAPAGSRSAADDSCASAS